jgi:inner membrane protein
MATAVLASNVPDFDILAAISGGSVGYLAAHRGPTHGLLGVGLLALASAFLVQFLRWQLARWRGRPWSGTWKETASIAGVALAGTFVHVLMDLPTSYGTRLLSPFDNTWFAFDWLPIVDIYVWGLLVGGLALAALKPAWQQRAAMGVLIAIVAFYGVRAVAHGRALGRAATMRADGTTSPCASAPTLAEHPRLIESAFSGQGVCIQAAALPTFLSPFTWRLVRQYPNGYEVGEVSLLGPPKADARGVWLPSEGDEWVRRARATRTARVFLNFSRFPAARTYEAPEGRRLVRIGDMRFVSALWRLDHDVSPRVPFIATVEFDAAGRIIRESLGP